MFASFIIIFHTRRFDNTLQTIRFLELWHPEVVNKSELVLVCQDRCGQIDTRFSAYQHYNLEVDNMQLPVLTNFGVEKSRSDKLVILESDRILERGYFQSVLSTLKDGMMVTTKQMMRPVKALGDVDIINNDFEHKWEYRSDVNQPGMRNMWSGNTACTKHDFYKAGKMDERYIGYGWADHDMTNAMTKIGVQSVFREDMEIHLWHEPMTYGSANQKKLFIDNGLRFCKKWGVPIPDFLQQEITQFSKIMI